jgi:hypothetical protein
MYQYTFLQIQIFSKFGFGAIATTGNKFKQIDTRDDSANYTFRNDLHWFFALGTLVSGLDTGKVMGD